MRGDLNVESLVWHAGLIQVLDQMACSTEVCSVKAFAIGMADDLRLPGSLRRCMENFLKSPHANKKGIMNGNVFKKRAVRIHALCHIRKPCFSLRLPAIATKSWVLRSAFTL